MEKITTGGKLRLLLSAVILIGGVFYVSETFAPTEEPSETDSLVEQSAELGVIVSYVEGAVEYKENNGEWKRLEEGAVLEEGDSVETFTDGRVILKLDDGSVLRLNGDSEVALTSMEPNKIVITNIKGEIYSRVVKLERTFQVLAGEIVYESLGTAYTTINKNTEKGVEVFHSKVKVLSKEKETVVEEGKMFFVKHVNTSLEQALADIPEEKLEQDEFVKWNKEKDEKIFKEELGVLANNKELDSALEKIENVKEEAPVVIKETVLTPAKTGIELSYIKNGKVTWVDHENVDNGFKIVWSKESNPIYPTRKNDKSNYISDSSKTEGSIYAFDGGGTYYIRVCEYLDGECGVYSNQVQATFLDKEEKKEVPSEEETGGVNSISLSASGSKVTWSVNGYAAQGFKVVYSKEKNPVYPPRDTDKAQYVSNPETISQKLYSFKGEGTYYVRVCEYISGKCGVYSNEVKVEL